MTEGLFRQGLDKLKGLSWSARWWLFLCPTSARKPAACSQVGGVDGKVRWERSLWHCVSTPMKALRREDRGGQLRQAVRTSKALCIEGQHRSTA